MKKIIRITTQRAMHMTPEVVEMMKNGINPYDHIVPTGPKINTITVMSAP